MGGTMKAKFFVLGFLCLGVIASGTSQAEEVLVLTFDNFPPTVQCNDVWQEHTLDMWFTETTEEDDQLDRCEFDATQPGEIWLYPSRFMVDIGYSFLINRVEVDVMSNCGDCTRAFLYHEDATVASAMAVGGWNEETLVLTPAGGSIDAIAVSSSEGLASEIRIYSDTTPNDVETWAAVKIHYR
jgi:hypothetical protein